MSDSIVESIETLGLIDSGAGGKFIDQDFTKESGFKTLKLEEPLRVLNVDGTENKRGTIRDYVELNNKRKEILGTTNGNRIGKRTDHFGIPLAYGPQSRHKLENWTIFLEGTNETTVL